MDPNECLGLAHEKIGCLPVVNWFLSRMGLAAILERHLPHDDARLRLAPAAVIGLVVRNLVCSHRPLYGLGEWAGAYEVSQLGLESGDLEALNDEGRVACSTGSSTVTGRASSPRSSSR
jgi:hypothetical protein